MGSVGAAILGIAATLLLAYVVVVELGGALVTGVVRLLVLLPRGIVWMAVALETGTNGWVIAGRIIAAGAGAIKVPVVSVAVIVLELMGAGALLALRRLLRDATHRAE